MTCFLFSSITFVQYITSVYIRCKLFSKPSNSSSSANKTNKGKYGTLTIQYKLKTNNRLEKDENRNFIMWDLNICSSRVYDIKNKQKEELKMFAAQGETTKNVESRCTLKNLNFKFLTVLKKKTVTGLMFIEKAKQFHLDLNLEISCVRMIKYIQYFVRYLYCLHRFIICVNT